MSSANRIIPGFVWEGLWGSSILESSQLPSRVHTFLPPALTQVPSPTPLWRLVISGRWEWWLQSLESDGKLYYLGYRARPHGSIPPTK